INLVFEVILSVGFSKKSDNSFKFIKDSFNSSHSGRFFSKNIQVSLLELLRANITHFEATSVSIFINGFFNFLDVISFDISLFTESFNEYLSMVLNILPVFLFDDIIKFYLMKSGNVTIKY